MKRIFNALKPVMGLGHGTEATVSRYAWLVCAFSALGIYANHQDNRQYSGLANVIGHLKLQRGMSVEKKPTRSFDFFDVEDGATLNSGDVLFVGEGREAIIDLGEYGTFKVFENSMVELDFLLGISTAERALTLLNGSVEYKAAKKPTQDLSLRFIDGTEIDLSRHLSLAVRYDAHQANSKMIVLSSRKKVDLEQRQQDFEGMDEVEVERQPAEIVAKTAKRIFDLFNFDSDMVRKPTSQRIEVSLPRPRTPKGPLYHKNRWGYAIQVGAGAVTQKLNNPSLQAGAGRYKQLAMRNSLGLWYNKIHADFFWRKRMLSIDGSAFNPEWRQGFLGYGFDIGNLGFARLHLTLYGGWEQYTNNGGGRKDVFIKAIAMPLGGFRSRFVVNNTWEIGGDYFYGYLLNGAKHYVQGDIRYWMDKRWSFGAGYWYDSLSVKLRKSGKIFSESNYALETYLRYVY